MREAVIHSKNLREGSYPANMVLKRLSRVTASSKTTKFRRIKSMSFSYPVRRVMVKRPYPQL